MNEVHSGTLRKSPPEHKLMRTWQKRFFVLTRDKQLQYFKNEKDRRPVKDPIDLRSVTCIEASLQHKSFKHVFSINTKGRIYYLVADSQEEMEKWVEKLCEVCGFQKQDGRNSPRHSPDLRMLRNKKAATRQIPVGRKSSSMSPVSSVGSQSFTPQWTPTFGSPTCPLSKTMPATKNRATSDPPEPRHHIFEYSGARKQSVPLVQNYKQYSSSPTLGTRSSIQEEYNIVPTPRPISAAPHYDLVPPPNDFDHRYSTYDVPPSQVDGGSGEFYDTVPTPRTAAHYHETYDDVPRPRPDLGYEYNYPRSNRLEVYNDVPPPRPVSDSDTYDFPPPVGSNYDHVPAKRPLSNSQDIYDIVPPPRPTSGDSFDSLSRSENYDIVPVLRHSSHENMPPSDLQDTYDTVPCPKRATGGYSASLRQRPISQETYDEVPLPRPSHKFHRQASQENYNMVAAPRCPVSSTNTVNGSLNSLFSSQCSILSENIQGDRDSGLYDVPPGSVDYGYENTSRNEADSIYDVPPSKEDSDIYDVPPGHKDDIYDVPPGSRGKDIYDVPPGSRGEDIYDVPPGSRGEDIYVPPGSERNDIYDVPSSQADLYDFPPSSNETYDIPQSSVLAPEINRGAKPPPSVDRSCKPKPGQADHSYANMPPPVIRTLKPALEPIASPHSYENFPGKHPTLRKVDSLPGTPPRRPKPATVTRAQSMAIRQDPIVDTDYCHMVPSRSESTRLYSLTKKPIKEDASYEDMGSVVASDIRRESGYSDSTSSSSDHDDDNGQYINMENSKRRLSPPPPALPPGGPRSRKRDIEYTEVTLSLGQRNQCPIPPPRPPPNSNYTTIDVDLSRGLQQTRNEKAQGTVDS